MFRDTSTKQLLYLRLKEHYGRGGKRIWAFAVRLCLLVMSKTTPVTPIHDYTGFKNFLVMEEMYIIHINGIKVIRKDDIYMYIYTYIRTQFL